MLDTSEYGLDLAGARFGVGVVEGAARRFQPASRFIEVAEYGDGLVEESL